MGPECMVLSVPALSLVDCDSPADVLCIVSSCSVAVVAQCFHHLSHLPSCLHLVWFHPCMGGSTFSLDLFTIGSQVINNHFTSANICAIVFFLTVVIFPCMSFSRTAFPSFLRGCHLEEATAA